MVGWILERDRERDYVFAFALLVFLLVYGDAALDYNRCPIRRWLGTSLLVSLCIVVTTYCVPRRSWCNLLLALVAFLLAASTYLGLPSKDHALRGGQWGPSALVVLTFVAIPSVLGLVCFVHFALEQFWNLRIRRQSSNILDISAIFALSLSIVLGSTLIGARILTAGTSDPMPSWTALAGWTSCAALICLLFWAWALRADAPQEKNSHITYPTAIARCAAGLFAMLAAGGAVGLALITTVSASFYLSYHISQSQVSPPFRLGNIFGMLSAVLACMAFEAYRFTSSPGRQNTYQWITVGCLAWIGTSQFVTTSAAVRPQLHSRAIVCLDATSGVPLWACEALRGPQSALHRANSAATPTAVAGHDRVRAYFGSEGLMCSNLEGRLLWENRDVAFASAYGVGTSPILEDGIIIVVSGRPHAPFVCAIDSETGSQLWRHETTCKASRVSGVSRTPIVMSLGGTKCVLVWDMFELSAFDLRTGQRRCNLRLQEAAGDMVASLAVDDKRVYCSSPAETIAIEFCPERSTPRVCWRTRFVGANCSSPVWSNGLLFVVSDNGVITCLDASTGKICWRKRLPGEYFSSLLVVGRYLYASNREGNCTVVEVSKKFRIISENSLGEPFHATFGVAEGCLYTRGEKYVMCVGEPESAEG